MRKKWKVWGLVSICIVLVFTMAACGNSNTSETNATSGSATPTPTEEPVKEPVKLTFWGGIPAETGPQAVVDDWNAKNPDIQVEYVRYVNDDAGNLKLDTALQTGENIDLYVSYNSAQLANRIKGGFAADLTDILKANNYDVVAKMGESAKDTMVDGKYYALPTTKDLQFFWLNKDALDAAGLPVPFDWTWDDVQAYAAKLTKDKTFGLLQFDFEIPIVMDGTMVALGNTKADQTSNLDQSIIRHFLEVNYAMMHTDKSMPTLGDQLANKLPLDKMFLSGEGNMLHAGGWIFRSANNLKDFPRTFKIAFAPVPRIAKEQQDFKIQGGTGDLISINGKSKNQEAAWKFLQWYADGGMLPLAAGGRIPASKDADQDAAAKMLVAGAEDTYDLESLKNVVLGVFPVFRPTLEKQVQDARKEELEKYFLNSNNLDQTMKNITERHNKFIKENAK